MELQQVIKFLDTNGWSNVDSNDKFVFYKPPTELGFRASYTLPVPIMVDSNDFDRALHNVTNTISQLYDKEISELIFDVGNYLEIIKNDALYFKLSSQEILFDKTLEVDQIWQFLRNLTKSYSNYIKIKFTHQFKDIFDDSPEKINNAASSIIKYSRLRLVDLEYKSFSIGVSADNMMGNENIDIQEVKDWRKEIIPLYKKEIIDLDYSSKKDVDNILEQFNEVERKEIFDPLIKSINKKEYNIYLTDSKFSPRKLLLKIPKTTVKTIIPVLENKDKGSNIELVQIITPIDKSKKTITFNTEQLGKNLFSLPTEDFYWNQTELIIGEKTIEFINPITYHISLNKDNGVFTAEFKELSININTDNFNEIKNSFVEALTKYYEYYTHLLTQEKEYSPEEKEIIDFFSMNIKDKASD